MDRKIFNYNRRSYYSSNYRAKVSPKNEKEVKAEQENNIPEGVQETSAESAQGQVEEVMEPAAFETVDETVEIDIADKDEESLISHINEQEGQEQEQDQNPDQNQSQELNQVQDQEKEQSLIGSYHTQYVIEGLEKLYKIYQKKKEK